MYNMIKNLPDMVDEPVSHDPMAEPEAGTEVSPNSPERIEEGGQSSAPKHDYSHIPEAWRPGEFANSDEELEFYRSKYADIHRTVQSEEFANQFLETYRDSLTATEKEVEDFKGLLKAFKEDPHSFIAANMPEYADALGLQKLMSDEEIDIAVDAKIAEEFGEDWEEQFDIADLKRRSSLSSKIQRRRAELERSLEEQNKSAEENRKGYIKNLQSKNQQAPQQDPNAIVNVLEQAYNDHFKEAGFSEEEFVEAVSMIQSYQPDLTDLYRMTYYEDLVEMERQEAREEGRRAVIEELRRAGKLAAADYKLEQPTPTGHEGSKRGFLGMRVNI